MLLLAISRSICLFRIRFESMIFLLSLGLLRIGLVQVSSVLVTRLIASIHPTSAIFIFHVFLDCKKRNRIILPL